MGMKYQSLRGTKDILPEDSRIWRYVEGKISDIFARFGYQEIRTPIFEMTELFVRSIGASTDIVNKEMYTFPDKKGRSLTLRPEGTAPVVRAYIQNQLYQKDEILKLYYKGPFFRYERPQAGRERQFHQFGVEVLGASSPAIDTEIIYLGYFILKSLGLDNAELLLGSVGCSDCRPAYEKLIVSTLRESTSKLCDDCQKRYKTNPLRMLDCKNEDCKKQLKKIPPFAGSVCDDCKKYLNETEELLKLLEVSYIISPHLVRGLDYYTRTTFEFVYSGLGAQSTVIGGGRYNNLIKEFGGPSVSACGFAGGMERLISVLKNEGKIPSLSDGLDVFVIPISDECFKTAFKLLQEIRSLKISADMDYRNGSLKSQFRKADKLKASYVIVIGEDEMKKGAVKLKDMKTGSEENIKLTDVTNELKRRLRRTMHDRRKNRLKDTRDDGRWTKDAKDK